MRLVFFRSKTVYGCTLFLLLLLLPLLMTAAQESAKTLEWSDQAIISCGRNGTAESQNYEIELEDILIDGRSIFVGEPFVGDIRDLVFQVQNISDRPIGFIQITVVLPEVKRPPQVPFVRTSPESKNKPLQPGEQTELRVPRGKLYDWVRDTVVAQGMQLQSIKRAAIYPIVLDGKGGCLKARDPRNDCPARR